MKSLNEEEQKLIQFIYCDLSDFNSIIEFADKVRKGYILKKESESHLISKIKKKPIIILRNKYIL